MNAGRHSVYLVEAVLSCCLVFRNLCNLSLEEVYRGLFIQFSNVHCFDRLALQNTVTESLQFAEKHLMESGNAPTIREMCKQQVMTVLSSFAGHMGKEFEAQNIWIFGQLFSRVCDSFTATETEVMKNIQDDFDMLNEDPFSWMGEPLEGLEMQPADHDVYVPATFTDAAVLVINELRRKNIAIHGTGRVCALVSTHDVLGKIPCGTLAERREIVQRLLCPNGFGEAEVEHAQKVLLAEAGHNFMGCIS